MNMVNSALTLGPSEAVISVAPVWDAHREACQSGWPAYLIINGPASCLLTLH